MHHGLYLCISYANMYNYVIYGFLNMKKETKTKLGDTYLVNKTL